MGRDGRSMREVPTLVYAEVMVDWYMHHAWTPVSGSAGGFYTAIVMRVLLPVRLQEGGA
eukprot:CAMPEP_0184388206 /NCGR_PEP_ID=MMETSP0007-20130409/11408_1 /TAXON_ID=97485 /ORGANISM="Prymnesium parvum, Strain Texoma1" /LENGTH=58 /DNA_ID=CAMNT_0026736943 /DNA_START=182 /DNA_END=358 /DNA_ORIENTATION=+